ncbi:MAG: ribonuclease D [Pseudomonadota bacterium]|nr:ribonuclease D [Pseudomonadota bacterium]
MSLQLPPPRWITSDAALAEACQHWQTLDWLALDTEFIRTSTFYPRPGLVQVGDLEHNWLIDPLEIQDWSAFAAVLSDESVVKVFHACAEDLEVCRLLTGTLPAPLFDTQLAMAFLGLGSSVGFQRAVADLLEVDLPKGATRTDWLQRPLTAVQVEYAAADVHFLRQLYPMLAQRLDEAGRTDWLNEEAQRQLRQATEVDFSQAYQRVKLGWKLRPQEQAVLQSIAAWREEEARARDVPRNKVADDSALWNIARFRAKNRDQLIKAGIKPAIVRECGQALLQKVLAALALDSQQWPQQLNKPLSIDDGNRMKALKKQVVAEAERHKLPPELLANKKMLDALVRHNGQLPVEMTGWRRALIGDALVASLSAMLATGN